MRTKVYISGPITKGDRNHNYAQSLAAQRELMLRGYAPLNPMLTITCPFAWEEQFPHAMWMEVDLPWVEVCDAVLRLPGDSVGADVETSHASLHGIPVFHSMDELDAWEHEVTAAEAKAIVREVRRREKDGPKTPRRNACPVGKQDAQNS